MIFACVAGLSLCSLAFELLLTRYFSIAHWSHLSFVVISIAMFGTAAAGTFHFLLGRRGAPSTSRRRNQDRTQGHGAVLDASRDPAWSPARELFPGFCILGAFSTIAAFLAVKNLPLDYLRFPVDPRQAVYLLAAYLVLSLPFFASGLASCAAYAALPEKSGAISSASMLGAGAGALLPAILLPLAGEGGAIAVVSLIPLAPAVFFPLRNRRILLPAAAAAVAALLLWLMLWQGGAALSVFPSAYKSLPQLLLAPGSLVVDRATGIEGRVDVVESPSIRWAPGLSLSWQEALPRETGLLLDGDSMTVLLDVESCWDFASATHPFAAFALGAQGNCLVLQRGGGLGVACAREAGARRITTVVERREIASRIRERYGKLGIEVVAENPRAFLARSQGGFDTVFVESWGPTVIGSAGLEEDQLFTVDAMRQYLRALKDAGLVAFARKLLLPPSDSLRIFSTALEVLRMEGARDPSRHLAVIRNWDTCTILVFRQPLEGERLIGLKSFAERLSFDLDYFPGIAPADANRFNVFDRPWFSEAYLSIVRDPSFLAQYFLDVAPQEDDRPFPGHFLRLGRIRAFFEATGGRIYSLFLSGELIAAVAMVEAAVVSLLLLAAPGLLRDSHRRRFGGPRFLFFSGIGLGYLLVEIYCIYSFTLLLPSQSVALAVTLGGLLCFSGVGSLLSERLGPRGLRAALACASALILTLAFLFPAAMRLLLRVPSVPRIMLSVGLAAVPGVLLGLPFPAGMRLLALEPRERAFAWALNGCASVIASTSSVLVAPMLGLRSLMLIAAGGYAAGLAGMAVGRLRKG